MGLLDVFNSEQGRMGLGLLGGGFGQQLRQGVESMDAYKKQQMIAQIQQLQMQRAQAEMADQVEQRKAQAEQLIEQQRQQELFRNAGRVPLNMQGTGQANDMLPEELRIGAQAELQKPGQIDYNALREKGMSAALMKQLAEIQTLGLPEVARTIKGMKNGREVEQQFDKFGREVGQGFEQFKAPIMMDRGAQIEAVSPYTAPGATFGKTMTFADKNAAANLALSQQRLKMEQGNQNKPQWIEALGGFADPRTQRVMPARDMHGNVIEGSGKAMTEDQGKATGWLVQAQNALKNMDGALALDPSASKPGINDAIAAIPSFGFSSGVANLMRGDNRQKFMQASSSLSEALLRAATGAGFNANEAKQKIDELTPVIGDTDAVIAQKRAAIPIYIESLKVRAGPGAKKAAGISNTGGAQGSWGGTASDPLGLFK